MIAVLSDPTTLFSNNDFLVNALQVETISPYSRRALSGRIPGNIAGFKSEFNGHRCVQYRSTRRLGKLRLSLAGFRATKRIRHDPEEPNGASREGSQNIVGMVAPSSKLRMRQAFAALILRLSWRGTRK